jgi:hypothetical protein
VSGEPTRSPRILSISWGRMDVEDLGVGKDFKLHPGVAANGTGPRAALAKAQASSPTMSKNSSLMAP